MNWLFFISILLPYSISSPTSDWDLTESEIIEMSRLNSLTNEINSLGGTFILPDLKEFDESKISYYVYNKDDTEGTQVAFDEGESIESVSAFDTSLETVFIIHGWTNDYQSNMPVELKAALLETGDYNVIVVDWDLYSKQLYLEATLAVPHVGEVTGNFIQNIIDTYNYSWDKITLIGHSLGAHISGFTGKTTNGMIGTIIGLDPANPLFFKSDPSGRLNSTDAKFVEAIHTSSTLAGVYYSLGDVDFWPNGGSVQPGCNFDLFGQCAHGRSYQYMVESIIDNKFVAKRCINYSTYDAGKCNNNLSNLMGGKPGSYNTKLTGSFYLNTNSTEPFGLGVVDP